MTINNFNYLGYVTGTTRLKLNQAPMRKIPVPLAPLSEQHRIVAKIEELFSHLDAGQDALQKAKVQLKRYRESVLKAAVEGRLTDEWRKAHLDVEHSEKLLKRILREKQIKDGRKYKETVSPSIVGLPKLPGGWIWTSLSQIGELNRGISKHRPRDDPKLYGGSYPFIQTGDVRNAQGTLRSYSQTYSEEGLNQSRLWSKGTLLIAIAANIADTAILGFDACFPDSIVGFLTDPRRCNIKFVEIFIRTAKKDIEKYAPATAQKNINLRILSDLVMPFPPLEEQNVIVNEVERLLSISNQTQKVVEQNHKITSRLHRSILKHAFEGRLVPQDPSDEPASVLLERIKAEKAKQFTRKERKNNHSILQMRLIDVQ